MSAWEISCRGNTHGICAMSLAPCIPAPPAAAGAHPAPQSPGARSVPPLRNQPPAKVPHYWRAGAGVCFGWHRHGSPDSRGRATLSELWEQEECHRPALQTPLGYYRLSNPAILLRTRNAARAWLCARTLHSRLGRTAAFCSSGSPHRELLSTHSTGTSLSLRPTKRQ